MKNVKKVISVFLALLMMLSMVTTAFAENQTKHTITINNAAKGYEYAAYQIFKGDLKDDGQLQNIAWGENIDSTRIDDLMAKLKENTAFAACKNVVDVATVLSDNTEDEDVAKAFADIVSGYLTDTNAGESSYSDSDKKYTISVDGDGYYLIENTEVPAATPNTAPGSYTRYILKVVGDVNVTHKGTVPTVVKKIKEGNELVDANTADIGDTVTYQFTGTMPSNIADYDTYYYVFNDTMSEGLTYTNNLKVEVNGKDVTPYFWSNNKSILNEPGATLKVGMQDILVLELIDLDPNTDGVQSVGEINADTQVVVTYTALVNEKAKVGVDGETNKVKLQFSNDPNNDGEGATTPPEGPEEPNPDPNVPTGETPEDIVKTFTTEIKITKTDGLTNGALTGAKFKIEGVSSKVVVVNKEMYVEDSTNGSYYRLKDGTYTVVAPVVDNPDTEDINEDNTAAYESTTVKYKKITEVTTETIEETCVTEGWVDSKGVITFTGLGEGTYTITELVAPNGYNLLEDPIIVVITSTVNDLKINEGTENVEWSATVDKNEITINNGIVEFTVQNTSGATLPETGGMGTTLFYVCGSVLAIGAVILLVTKRRMGGEA